MASDRFHLYWRALDKDPKGDQYSLVIPKRLKLDPDDRRQRLYESARYAFSLLLPSNTLIMAEEPLALKNGKTTRVLGLAAGAIWAAHMGCDVFWSWVDVSHWKKEVIGNGNADKDIIRQWVQDNLGLEFDEPDFYDAACLCRYGEIRLAGGAIQQADVGGASDE